MRPNLKWWKFKLIKNIFINISINKFNIEFYSFILILPRESAVTKFTKFKNSPGFKNGVLAYVV